MFHSVYNIISHFTKPPFVKDYLLMSLFKVYWEGLVTKYHKKHVNEIGIQSKVEAYIQFLVLKKTFESLSFDRRRGIEEDDTHEEIATLVRRVEAAATGSDAKIIQA